MSYRGRLIFPFEVEIYRVDMAGTAADPDGAGGFAAGFDADFREPVVINAAVNRKELDPIRLPCQVELEREDEQAQRAGGDDPTSLMRFVFHFEELEAAGLVDANGKAKLNKNDRAVAIYQRDDGALVQRLDVNGSGGLFCTGLQADGLGLSGLRRNLLVATYERRRKTP